MAARLVPGMPKVVDISKLRFSDIGAQRRRRAAVAFITGSVLFVTSAAAMISDGASAQGPGRGMFSGMFAPSSANFETYSPPSDGRPTGLFLQTPMFDPYRQTSARPPGFAQIPLGPPGRASKRNKARATGLANNRKSAPYSVALNYSSRRPVCVRLCDGFFFPASVPAGGYNAASEEAACAGLCPDAPIALYYQPSGSDRIEDAFSATGQRYDALPIALRYRSTQDNTCSCHRSLATALNALHDPTLRNGDAFMTPKGFVVFHGAEQATHTPRDFAALAGAKLPKDQRTTLQALERVSMAPQPGVTRSWLAAEATPPAPIETATRDINKIRFVERQD